MSESSNEQSTEQGGETPDVGLIPDEDLPEDLQPDKNTLAADPDDEPDDSADTSAGPDTQVEGMPDMGQPG